MQGLKGLVNLTSLFLAYNHIGADGAQALKGQAQGRPSQGRGQIN